MCTKTHVNIETTISLYKASKTYLCSNKLKKKKTMKISTQQRVQVFTISFFLVSSSVDLQFVSAFLIYVC